MTTGAGSAANYGTVNTGTTGRTICSVHDVAYRSAPRSIGCPACLSDRQVGQMQAANQKMRNELEMMHDENQALRAQVDIVSAMRVAAEILDDEDMAFLKVTLYEWRDRRSLAMKTTHGPQKKKRKLPPANGFLVMPRTGDPYGHLCSSVGGVAIAGYFDEATNTVGNVKAMEFLLKAMSGHLPGLVVTE